MDKSQLEKFVEQGLSQRQISEKLGKDRNSVRYWLVKFGLKTKRVVNPQTCLWCGSDILDTKRHHRKYCDSRCQANHRWELTKSKIALEEEIQNSKQAKRYLTETQGHRCEICGITEWQGEDLPMVLDHIDGNSGNNRLENLRLVCSNCDSQLPTYKNRNSGKGRHSRRQRYKEGKSY